MYKINDTLKYIILFLIILSIAFINNIIILWLYLLLISVYNLYKRNKILSFISFILIILLVLSQNNLVIFFFFKLLLIIDLLLTFYSYFFKTGKTIRIGNRKLRTMFYENNFDKVVENINKKKDVYYGEDILTDDEIERTLERKFLESRIRFYGFNKKSKIRKNGWNKLDILLLLFSIVIFIILIIIGR